MGKLAEAIADLEEEEALRLVAEQVAQGVDALAILDECRQGMDIVGKRYECKEYYLSELIMSGEIFKEATQLIEPALKQTQGAPSLGKVVVGTAATDIHDIGKNIVITMLGCAGFEVHDLGVDVPPAKFVERLKETGAPILGISGLMTTSFDPMKETVNALKEAGLRDKVTVLVGGGPVNEQVRDYVGADFCGKDALEAVEICRRILS